MGNRGKRGIRGRCNRKGEGNKDMERKEIRKGEEQMRGYERREKRGDEGREMKRRKRRQKISRREKYNRSIDFLNYNCPRICHWPKKRKKKITGQFHDPN